MVEALGAKVLKLVRTAIGAMEIGGLEIGKFRELTEEEIVALARNRSIKKPLRARSSGCQPDRKAGQAPRRTGKSARWAGGTRRRGHSE